MSATPSNPYKGLAAFADSELDARFFFGRERERDAVVANVIASRLTVLYGPSGAGKSSLLRAGVAQRLRALEQATVVVHDSWADDPAGSLVAAVRAECPELGPTAGLVDAVAAAAQRTGQVYLLLDQFEQYLLYHGDDGPLSLALPELLERPGLRVNALLALRSDALAELDAFSGRLPRLFDNLLRLDRLDRAAARAAVVGPLERYGELLDASYTAEPALIDSLIDEVAAGRVDTDALGGEPAPLDRVEAPYLQLVLERLWVEEQTTGSQTLRLETLNRLGGAATIVRDHVEGALGRLAAPDRETAANVIRQLITPSGAKLSHTAADLAGFTSTDVVTLRPLLETLERERIVRAVDGLAGGPLRHEIFHDVLAEPLLAWRAGYELEGERRRARTRQRRLAWVAVASLVALAVVATVAVFALLQRSDARDQERRAHGLYLAEEALAGLPTRPETSLSLALDAARLVPGTQTETVLRTSLLAMREQAVIHLGGRVVAASFAPRGGRLLVASSNGTAGVYTASGAELVRLPPQPPLTLAAWNPSGTMFATGAKNGAVTVWANDGRQLYYHKTAAPIAALAWSGSELMFGSGGHVRITTHGMRVAFDVRLPGAVIAAALTTDGRELIVASKHAGLTTTRIVDVRTGRVRLTLPEPGIDSITLSADGRLFASGSTDDTARLWSTKTGRLIHVLPMHGYVLAEAFSTNGTNLVTSSTDGTAAIWDVADGARILLLAGANGIADDAAFNPHGQDVSVAFGDRLARIYSTQDGHLLVPLAGHEDTVTSVDYNPSGRVIVTGSTDGTVRLWSDDEGNQLTTIDRRHSPVDALFAGEHVLTTAANQARVLSNGGQLLKQFSLPTPITDAAADGRSFALTDSRGDLAIGSTNGPVRTRTRLAVDAVAYAPDGTLVTGSRNGTIRIWAPGAATPRFVSTPKPVLAVSAASGRFLVREAGGAVRVYTLNGRPISAFNPDAQQATLAPNGQTIATSKGRIAELWNATTGTLLHRLLGHRSLVTDLQFSPDSRTLVTASDDHDARLWNTTNGHLLNVLRGHFFAIRTASFSPDGHWIVTASQFTAGLWNTTSGQLVYYLLGHTRPLTGASFSPNGDWIITASNDDTASIVRCNTCANLNGLEQLATQRLAKIK